VQLLYVSQIPGVSRDIHYFFHHFFNWLVVSTPLKNMKVRLDHHPNSWGKKIMFETTNQFNMFSIFSLFLFSDCSPFLQGQPTAALRRRAEDWDQEEVQRRWWKKSSRTLVTLSWQLVGEKPSD
jgi:hypothetical protein